MELLAAAMARVTVDGLVRYGATFIEPAAASGVPATVSADSAMHGRDACRIAPVEATGRAGGDGR